MPEEGKCQGGFIQEPKNAKVNVQRMKKERIKKHRPQKWSMFF
jgi:hypothetical protein